MTKERYEFTPASDYGGVNADETNKKSFSDYIVGNKFLKTLSSAEAYAQEKANKSHRKVEIERYEQYKGDVGFSQSHVMYVYPKKRK